MIGNFTPIGRYLCLLPFVRIHILNAIGFVLHSIMDIHQTERVDSFTNNERESVTLNIHYSCHGSRFT